MLSGPNCLLFSGADWLSDSLWVRSDIGQSPRAPASVLGSPRELWIENFGGSWSRAIERKGPCLYVCTDGSRRACGVGACARLVATLGAPRETTGPRIDRFPPTRPSWWRRHYRDIQKLIFLAPRSRPICLLGPLTDRTMLKWLQVASQIQNNGYKTGFARSWQAVFTAVLAL